MYDFSGAFSGHQSFVVPVKANVVSDSERSLEQASELIESWLNEARRVNARAHTKGLNERQDCGIDRELIFTFLIYCGCYGD